MTKENIEIERGTEEQTLHLVGICMACLVLRVVCLPPVRLAGGGRGGGGRPRGRRRRRRRGQAPV